MVIARWVAAVVVAWLAVSAPVEANTGNELVKYCQEDAAWFDSGYCLGVVYGATQAMIKYEEYIEEADGLGVRLGCVPEGVTTGQSKAVFLKYAGDHPEQLHQNAVSLIFKALWEAFPCEE